MQSNNLLPKCSQIILTNPSHIFMTSNSHISRAAQNREAKKSFGNAPLGTYVRKYDCNHISKFDLSVMTGLMTKMGSSHKVIYARFSHKNQSYFACFPSSVYSSCTNM